jgi:hypothetical protein
MPFNYSFAFKINIEEVKKLNKKYPVKRCKKTVEMVDFNEAEAEKLEVVKRHMGLKQNKEAIKALIFEKCEEIKLAEEKQRKKQIEEDKAMEYLEKGKYTCPMYM